MFSKSIWLEVFVIPGINDGQDEIRALREAIQRISPDRIQLNTVTRPPAEDFAFPVSAAQMKIYRRLFGRNAEVIAEFRRKTVGGTVKVDEGEVMALLNRRPCTIQDIAAGLGLHPTQVAKAIEHLRDSGAVGAQRIENRIYYEPAQGCSAAPARRMKGETKVRRRKQTG